MAGPMGGKDEWSDEYFFYPSVENRLSVKTKIIKLNLK